MTNTKLQCTWRDGCNQLEACQAAECCQAVRSNREKAEQAPSNEKVPHGEIVYLPKITAEMVIDWNHPVELMKYEGGIQWTQDAVDFACLVAQHAYVEIGRLQTALQSSRDETARACQDYREALAENTKLKRAVSEPPADCQHEEAAIVCAKCGIVMCEPRNTPPPLPVLGQWASWLERELGFQVGLEVIRIRKEHVRNLIATLRTALTPPPQTKEVR